MSVLFFAVFFVVQLFLTWGCLMGCLINVYQLCQHLPRVMYAPFYRPERYVPGSGYLRHRVAFGEVDEGGHRHRPRLQVTDDAEDVVHPRSLVGILAARLVPLAQSLRVHHTQPALRVQPQVAHDGPAPCEQRTAVVSVPCLECLHHRVGGEVVGPLIVVIVPLASLSSGRYASTTRSSKVTAHVQHLSGRLPHGGDEVVQLVGSLPADFSLDVAQLTAHSPHFPAEGTDFFSQSSHFDRNFLVFVPNITEKWPKCSDLSR